MDDGGGAASVRTTGLNVFLTIRLAGGAGGTTGGLVTAASGALTTGDSTVCDVATSTGGIVRGAAGLGLLAM